MKYVNLIPFLAVLLLIAAAVELQGRQIDDPDRAFHEARELAFNNQLEESRRMLREILEVVPGYHDVRIFLARTYGWENRFSSARQELETVLNAEPRHPAALSALIDIEYWDDRPREALKIANRAVSWHPNDAGLLVQRARIEILMGNPASAARDLHRADELLPGMQEVRELRNSLEEGRLNNQLSASYTYDHYTDDFEPWQEFWLQLQRQTPIGPIIANTRVADRFGQTGVQWQVDMWPQLIRRTYGHFHIGYSASALYPGLRAGGEVYRIFPDGLEVSAGLRYMDFELDEVWIFTGSVNKYTGRWFYSIRPFLAPNDDGLSRSFVATVRRYLNSSDTYLSILIGYGFSPEERRLIDSPDEVLNLRSSLIGMNFYWLIQRNLQFFTEFRLNHQEVMALDDFIRIYTTHSGLRLRF